MWKTRTHAIGCFAFITAGAGLIVAIATERLGGLVPCALCLWERWPYRIAIVLGLLGAVLPRMPARAMSALAVLVMLAGAGIAVVHVGVEQGAWPSPLPECAAPRLASGSIADRLASMPARPSKPCDDPTYLVPGLPISMTTMNLLYSLGIAGVIAAALWHTRAVPA